MNKIETFINDMKKSFPAEMEMIFYHGYCYWFAFILAERFKGEIWFNPTIVHFASKIGNSLYDIFGEIEPGVNPFTGVYDRNNDDCYIGYSKQECAIDWLPYNDILKELCKEYMTEKNCTINALLYFNMINPLDAMEQIFTSMSGGNNE